MLNSAEGMLARSLLRRHWRATIALALFAGLAGGAALGAWGIARRTATVYDRFQAYEGASTVTIYGCPEGITEDDIEANGFEICFGYDYADLREFLNTLPEVESAGRRTYALSQVASANDPDRNSLQLVPVAIDPEAVPTYGSPIIVEGRLADPGVATEATINEEGARRLGVGVGEQVVITPYRSDQFDVAGEGSGVAGGVPTAMTVVGITRRPSDLVGTNDGTSILEDTSAVTVGPGWWKAIGEDAAVYGIGVDVLLASPGTEDLLVETVRNRFGDRLLEIEAGQVSGDDSQQTVRDAIRLQTVGVYLIAGVLALAGFLFAGQAVSRQSRLEATDAAVLDAMGMTRRGMVAAGARRASVVAGAAALVAAGVAIALSPLGPIGIGRAAEPHRGVRIDWTVLVTGLPIVALGVMVSAMVPIATLRVRVETNAPVAKAHRSLSSLPPPGVAGWAMTNSRRAGRLAFASAIVGVAVAAAVAVAAWSLVTSYDELRAEPARYGSGWDAQVGNVGSMSQRDDTHARLESIPGIAAVGILSIEGIPGDSAFTIFAGEPFMGDVDFGTIIAGRAPTRPTEAALGRTSMRHYDVGLGDTFMIADPGGSDNSLEFEVVGEAVVNDALAARPGVGALVTQEGLASIVGGVINPWVLLSQTYAVYIDPDADRDATLAALREAFPTTFLAESTPAQVSNLGLVSDQPVWVALIIGSLAGAALIHALVTSVRSNRRQIGVLKSIGFTKRQVMSTVAWHASLLTGAALVVGIPLGIVVGRVTWSAIVDNLGVLSSPVVPLAAIAGVVVLVLALANLAALGPAWAAARTRAATALRTE
jgi:putative ABC transport system permease protein